MIRPWYRSVTTGLLAAITRDTPAVISSDPVPAPAPSPPHDIYRAAMQLHLAEAIGWIVDRVTLEGPELTMSGWALPYRAPADAMRFLINREPFQQAEWPLASPDVAQVYEELPFAGTCRFVCRHRGASAADLFVDDYACLSFVGGAARTARHPA